MSKPKNKPKGVFGGNPGLTTSIVERLLSHRKLFLCCRLLAVALLSGCQSAHLGNYKLEKLDGESVVLPPPYWNHSESKMITIHFSIPAAEGLPPHGDCSVAGALFGLSLKRGSSSEWIGTLPSLHAWRESVASGSFSQEFERFLNEIGKLADSGCFPLDWGAMLAEGVKESFPTRTAEADFYRYGYRLGTGFIDLEPGIRLKIVRADFDSLGKYQDTTTVYYRIWRDSDQTVRFRLESDQPKEAGGASLPDLTFAARDSGMFYGRLFFLGKQVPPNLNYAAMVVGTRSPAQMEEITDTIRMRPEVGCSASAGREIACVPFQGPVSVSAEIEVNVQGSPVFVQPGETVRGLFSKSNRIACQSDLRSLRIEREFFNKLTPVNFDSAGDSILDLVLVGGDHIYCSGR